MLRVGGRCGQRFDILFALELVGFALAAQSAVGIAFGLFALVVASFPDVGFRVVLLNPGQDMLGVKGDGFTQDDAF